jgi:uncharacterized protein (DUF2336 family)
MMIRQFLALTQHVSPARRAEGARALVWASLNGHLTPDTAEQARATILALLDDPATQVRRTLAEACAASPAAPRALVVALAGDHADIAALVLKHSPVLTDADLVDGIAIGCETTRQAIAERRDLSYAVAGAMAEIAGPRALTALAANHSAGITIGSLLRAVARHGDDAPLREALLARPDLPLEVRQACTDRVAEAMAQLAVEEGWLTSARGERAGREARERATLSLSAGAPPEDLGRLVAYLRRNGQLNAGLILRAILSGHMPFAEIALADLADLPPARVAGLMHEGADAAYAALHRRAGLPSQLLPAFGAALSAWREAGRGASTAHGAALSCLMIERAISACETMPFADAQGVLALLTRFEAEAARESAREQTRAAAERAAPEHRTGRRIPALGKDPADAKASGHRAGSDLRHAALAPPAAVDFPEAAPLPLRPTPRPAAEAHAAILDAEWREAREGVPDAAALGRTLDAVAEITGHHAVADLSEAAPASAEPDVLAANASRTDPVGLIFEALPHAILAEFQADRAARITMTSGADDIPADTIPSDLVASYRADRVRVHLAA